MMTMESVDLSDVNCIAQQTLNDNTDKGPVSLEQIRIEESEERFGNLDIESATCENYHFSWLTIGSCNKQTRRLLSRMKTN